MDNNNIDTQHIAVLSDSQEGRETLWLEEAENGLNTEVWTELERLCVSAEPIKVVQLQKCGGRRNFDRPLGDIYFGQKKGGIFGKEEMK